MARFAVTGAHGFVGLNVARMLASDGHEVLAVSRRPPDALVLEFLKEVANVQHVRADLSVRGALRDALRGRTIEGFVHAAVVTATTLDVERTDAARIIHTNIGGTIDALDAARETGARRFVYISSPSAIGSVPPDATMNESIPKNPDTLYGITKDASEEIVRRYAYLHELAGASVRIAQPYGPGERPTASRVRTSPIYEWILSAEAGQELVTGPFDRQRDWTYIDDTARGIATLVSAPQLAHDLYHLSTGRNLWVGEVIEVLRTVYPDLRVNTDPREVALNPNIASAATRPPLDVSRFSQEFGWRPRVDITCGLRRYLDWRSSFSVK